MNTVLIKSYSYQIGRDLMVKQTGVQESKEIMKWVTMPTI
jgi:hypothetical protein